MKNPKYQIECHVCSLIFKSSQPYQKYCSDDCRKKAYYETSGRVTKKFEKLPTGTVWKISEMAVATELLKLGYTVFYALSNSSYCDLIAIKEEQILHVEARTGYLNKFTNNFAFPAQHRGKTNVFGVYERNNGTVHFFDLKRNEVKDLKSI